MGVLSVWRVKARFDRLLSELGFMSSIYGLPSIMYCSRPLCDNSFSRLPTRNGRKLLLFYSIALD